VPQGRPPVPPFSLALLPAALAPWVADIADRVQCPPDFVAVGVMLAAAAVIGRQLAIRPKRQDDWAVVPNLWGSRWGHRGA
jgi:putative DNA primase/helicase